MPAHKFVTVDPVETAGDQLYVYGPVPPLGATEMEPSQIPGQVGNFCDCVTEILAGWVIVIVEKVIQPTGWVLSVICDIYTPAQRLVIGLTVVVVAFGKFHISEKGGVLPVISPTAAAPVQTPLQLRLVCDTGA